MSPVNDDNNHNELLEASKPIFEYACKYLFQDGAYHPGMVEIADRMQVAIIQEGKKQKQSINCLTLLKPVDFGISEFFLQPKPDQLTCGYSICEDDHIECEYCKDGSIPRWHHYKEFSEGVVPLPNGIKVEIDWCKYQWADYFKIMNMLINESNKKGGENVL